MQTFQESQNVAFRDRLVVHLRENYAVLVEPFDNQQLLKAIAAAQIRAAAYGFAKQSSVLAFVTLTFAVSPEFDRQERIHQLLSESIVPADARIAYLADAISAAEWDEARRIGAR